MKKLMMIIAVMFFPVMAFALDLHTAKSQGLVGEKMDGYIAAVSDSPAQEVQDLVKDINGKRRERYLEISQKNAQPLRVVEQLTAEKVFESLEPGEYYTDKSGKWMKK